VKRTHEQSERSVIFLAVAAFGHGGGGLGGGPGGFGMLEVNGHIASEPLDRSFAGGL
jgi:hypothetical protein